MKITGVKGYHLALPKNSTTIIGGVDNYSGHLYRDTPDEQVKDWVGQSVHFANVMTYLVEVHTDEGIVGYGEVESLYGARGSIRMAGENLIDADPLEIQHDFSGVMLGQGNTLRTGGKNPRMYLAKEQIGIEFALWDIAGKKMGVPVYNLMGGKVREKQAITLFLGQKPIDNCLSDIDRAVKEGIRTIKIKAGANDRRDVDLLRAIRDTFGWELILRVDPNGAWGDVTDAVRILKQMEPYNLQYIEDGVCRTDIESHRRLREMTDVPVCICGMFNGPVEMTAHEALIKLADVVRQDAADVVSLDPSRTGGLLGFTQVAAFCEGAGIELVTHRGRGGLMQAIWLTGLSTCYSASYAQDIVPLGQPSSIIEDIITHPLTHENGFMRVPDGNGFGVEINWDNVKKYCLGTEQAGDVGE